MEIEQTTKYKRELKKVLKSPIINQEKIDTVIDTFINNPTASALDAKKIRRK